MGTIGCDWLEYETIVECHLQSTHSLFTVDDDARTQIYTECMCNWGG